MNIQIYSWSQYKGNMCMIEYILLEVFTYNLIFTKENFKKIKELISEDMCGPKSNKKLSQMIIIINKYSDIKKYLKFCHALLWILPVAALRTPQ